jgi:hypothetical protein
MFKKQSRAHITKLWNEYFNHLYACQRGDDMYGIGRVTLNTVELAGFVAKALIEDFDSSIGYVAVEDDGAITFSIARQYGAAVIKAHNDCIEFIKEGKSREFYYVEQNNLKDRIKRYYKEYL